MSAANDDEKYLFDREGPADPQIQRFETLLGGLGYRPARTPAPPATPPADTGRRGELGGIGRTGMFSLRRTLGVAAAASVAAAAVGWQLAPTTLDANAGPAVAVRPAADWDVVETSTAPSRIELPGCASIGLEAATRVRVVRGGGAGLVYLDHGRVSLGDRLPGSLPLRLVTPALQASDQGGRYTLSVDPNGDTLVEVEQGFVRLMGTGREITLPAASNCRARSGAGPGTPFWKHATDGLRHALAAFDVGGPIAPVLEHSRVEDTITLWSLLTHPNDDIRTQTNQRLGQLFALPAATRDAQVADPRGLDAWQHRLGITW